MVRCCFHIASTGTPRQTYISREHISGFVQVSFTSVMLCHCISGEFFYQQPKLERVVGAGAFGSQKKDGAAQAFLCAEL